MQKKPTVYEAAGLGLGVVGAFSAVGLALKYWINLGPIASAATAILVLAVISRIIYRRMTQTPRLFDAASRDTDAALRFRANLAEGMRNEHAFEALERIYAPVIDAVNAELRRQGCARVFNFIAVSETEPPLLAVAIRATDGETLSGLLNPDWITRRDNWSLNIAEFASERQRYMANLRRVKRFEGSINNDDEGDNLVLDGLTVDQETGHLRLDVSLATYGQIVRSCDALLNEFTIFAYLSRDITEGLTGMARRVQRSRRLRFLRIGESIELKPGHVIKQLPWRQKVHAWAARPEDLLLYPDTRAAGLGVAVTMITRSENGAVAYVGRRSSAVGTYPDVLHVLPAGMCNTKEDMRAHGRPLRNDFLQWTMLGELLEECYNEEELAEYRTEDWVSHIRKKCAKHNVSTGPPIFTGIAFDLLNLRPEVCALVEVVDPKDKARRPSNFKLCWEYSPMHGITTVELARIPELCRRTDFVQSGAVSLVLASATYCQKSHDRKGDNC